MPAGKVQAFAAKGAAEPLAGSDAVAEAVRAGLAATPKWLPAWLFYDANGSRLFERITALPEYYLTRAERAIFAREADGIVQAACELGAQANTGKGKLRLLELGAGTASKTGLLLAAAVRVQGATDYLPVDVSPEALGEACAVLSQTLAEVAVSPQVGNYVTEPLRVPPHTGPTLALYIGSSIGNFAPNEAVSILQNLRAQLRPGDSLLLGTDLVKDKATLEAAYCDAEGVTEAFNLNLLHRLNRELGATFDLATFRHAACYNQAASRIEMHLRSTRAQVVRIPLLAMEVHFALGETIHTENSYKFTAATIHGMLQQAGFAVYRTYTDPRQWFAVTLAVAMEP